MCKIFEKLNLNFLNLPQHTKFVLPLKEDENNVFKPNLLTVYTRRFGSTYFMSILQRYVVPIKTDGQSQDDYNKSKS